MGIVTISRGSYSRGTEVAKRLAEQLGWECVSREIILEASRQFNIPEIQLVRAVHDAPTFLESLSLGKERYIAFFRSALFKHILGDNIVYHGFAGHIFLRYVPAVLKVRIIAALDERVAEMVARDQVDEDTARSIIIKNDQERKKWSLELYGIDSNDPDLYDLVLRVKHLTVDEAVQTIIRTLGLPSFQATPATIAKLEEMAAEARSQADWRKD